MDMGPTSPTPPSQDVSPEENVWSTTGPVLYGGAFIVGAALIFTLTIHPPQKAVAKSENAPAMPSLPLSYPASRTVAVTDTIFGVKVADPYRWLEDGKSP